MSIERTTSKFLQAEKSAMYGRNHIPHLRSGNLEREDCYRHVALLEQSMSLSYCVGYYFRSTIGVNFRKIDVFS